MWSAGVTLLSGGLDSTTVTAYARARVDQLTALTFDYGHTHGKEVDCARKVAEMLGVQHKLIDISFLAEVAWYSSLTSPERFSNSKDREEGEIGSAIPITYVPLRNTLFITIAGAYLESQLLHAIEVDGRDPGQVSAHIFLAPNAIDYSGYPDCRPEYYEKMRESLNYGSKLWAQYHVPMQIETPVIHLSKSQIVKMAMELKAPLEHTWSCYEGGDVPCGRCDSCILRAKGFAEAGCQDPLLVHPGKVSP